MGGQITSKRNVNPTFVRCAAFGEMGSLPTIIASQHPVLSHRAAASVPAHSCLSSTGQDAAVAARIPDLRAAPETQRWQARTSGASDARFLV
jgi:hypothetical protein